MSEYRKYLKRTNLKLVTILVDSKDDYEKITKIIGHDVRSAHEASIGYYMEFVLNDDEINRLKQNKIPFSIQGDAHLKP